MYFKLFLVLTLVSCAQQVLCFQDFKKSLDALLDLPQLSYVVASRKSFMFGVGFPTLNLHALAVEKAIELLTTRYPHFENEQAKQVANMCSCNAFLLNVILGLIACKRCSVKVSYRFSSLIVAGDIGWWVIFNSFLSVSQDVINEGLKVDKAVRREIEELLVVFLNAFLLPGEKTILRKLTVFPATFSESGALFVMEVRYC